MQLVKWISYKIVRFSDKSIKFGTEVEDHLTNKSGYWANADHAPFDRFRPLNHTDKIVMFNCTINKENDKLSMNSLSYDIELH